MVGEVEKAEDEPDDTWNLTLDKLPQVDERLSLEGSVYRGEGNANIVLTLPGEVKVVRFRKSSPGEVSLDGGRTRVIREIEFIKKVISGFLGDYVQPPEALRVSHEDVIKLSEAIRPLRPKHRRSKELVNGYATKYVDHAFLPAKLSNLVKKQKRPTFSVEIKPKQGFRNELDENYNKCTYCLTQNYKLKTGAIKSRSSYCPFDLFSGDVERMEKSIRGLIESPQNNFKIFKDGVVVYDYNSRLNEIESIFDEWFTAGESCTEDDYFNIFVTLIRNALLKEFPQSFKFNTTPHPPLTEVTIHGFDLEPRIDQELIANAKKILQLSKDESCNFDGGYLPQDSVLSRILYMQQLPYHNVDVVYKIYSKYSVTLNDDAIYSHMIKKQQHKEGKTESVKIEKSNETEVIDVRNSFKSDNGFSEDNGNKNENEPLELRNGNFNSGEIGKETKSSITIAELQALQNYLLVTIARDCAILMAFQEIDEGDVPYLPSDYIVEATEDLKFLTNINVLDLDPKTIHCIEKHRHRDVNVLSSLTKNI